MATETFAQSLWSALAKPLEGYQELMDSIEVDVLIVGAGFLGLSTALHLAESGARVALVEAEEAGFGASGRNTGFVVPSLKTAFGPADVARHIGQDKGDRLISLVGQSGNIVFDLIRRLGLECSAEQVGWMQPAHTASIAHVLEKRQADWRERGRTVEILTAEETARRVGYKGYHSALLDPTGGQVNPLAYARGLADACRSKGVALYFRSRVLELGKAGTKWQARTPKGIVAADRILLTTNALVGKLQPELLASIIPVRVHQIATQPFDATIQSTILIGRSPVADTRRHTFAVRWSPDGRLVTGGLVLPGWNPLERASRFFAKRLERFFPRIAPLKADYVWNGMIAATTDSLPRFLTLAPGLDAAIGCNGRGLALTTSLGRDIAGLYTGKLTLSEFPLAHEPPRSVPGRSLAEHGPSLWLPWSTFRDWQDARG
jgi:glycine/D-amino acid oxidase-like deaminating enzyme